MVVQHNIESLNAANAYNASVKSKADSMEKLSSGYRINRSADDAAGLAISQKMRYQIRGLDRANKNIGEGIDFVKVGDGGMNEIHAMLQRMKELSVQAATDTNAAADRDAIQKEIDSLTDEINEIAYTTNYNGIHMLNGEKAPSAPSGPGGGSGPIIGDGIAEALAKRVTYGGSGKDGLSDVIFENDSVVFCGYTRSTDMDLDGTGGTGSHSDGWVTKLDADGEILWTTKVGTGNTSDEVLNNITKTADGGYLAGGRQGNNTYLVKLDADGNKEWDYSFPTTGSDSGINGVRLMQDGSGHVFISLQTFDGNDIKDGNGKPLGGNAIGGRDTIILIVDPTKNPKINYTAFEVNSYRLGGSSNEQISKIHQTSDGGYIGGNYTTSGTITQTSASGSSVPPQSTVGNGHHHAYIVKFDAKGDPEKVLKFGDDNPPSGGNCGEFISQIVETSDGGYVVVGTSAMTDTVGNKPPQTDLSKNDNIWVMKLDKDLNPVWSRNYGSSASDSGSSIVETDAGYVVAGRVGALDGDVSPKAGHSGNNAWIFMVDKASGDIIWNEVHGGSASDGFVDMFQTANGDILVAGNSFSNDIDLDGKNKGDQDAWFLRIDGKTGGTVGIPGGGGAGGVTAEDGDIILQTGAFEGNEFILQRADMRAKTLFGDPIVLDMSSNKTAGEAITKIDKAIEYVSSRRSQYGTYENALTHLSSANAITSENTSHSESKIADADMALLMVQFSKADILSQTGEAMLAQTNSSKENVLRLLQ